MRRILNHQHMYRIKRVLEIHFLIIFLIHKFIEKLGSIYGRNMLYK